MKKEKTLKNIIVNIIFDESGTIILEWALVLSLFSLAAFGAIYLISYASQMQYVKTTNNMTTMTTNDIPLVNAPDT